MHDNYKYRNLALNVLSTALDDICPKFDDVPPSSRYKLIKERQKEFKKIEKLVDAEWKALEREALYEVRALKEERLSTIRKLNATHRNKKIKLKIQNLKRNRTKRLTYLKEKFKVESANIQQKLDSLDKTSKKFAQISRKLDKLSSETQKKIKFTEDRYKKIIERTLKSDNSENVELRIRQAKEVWERKYKELERKYDDHLFVFFNKREEVDLIRGSVESFEEKFEEIKHLCAWAGIDVKQCYMEVRDRLSLLGRTSEIIENTIKKLHLGEM